MQQHLTQYNCKHFTIPVDFVAHLKELKTEKSPQDDWLMFFVSKNMQKKQNLLKWHLYVCTI